jgi:Putative transposase
MGRASLRCVAPERHAQEQLCRYISRPAPARKRVQRNAAGQAMLERITPWHTGTRRLVITPSDFTQRLAALVQHPRMIHQ